MRAPTAALIHVPADGEEQTAIRALSPSASGALYPSSPGPSHRLLLCHPALGLPLGKGRWPALLGTCSAPLGTYPAPLGTRPALWGHVLPCWGHVLSPIPMPAVCLGHRLAQGPQ